MDKIRVAIADDNKLMANVLEEIIQQDQDMEIVGKASDGEEAYQLIRSKHPDVMLLDIIMPKLDGLSAVSYTHLDVYKRQAYDKGLEGLHEQLMTIDSLLNDFNRELQDYACLLYTSPQ